MHNNHLPPILLTNHRSEGQKEEGGVNWRGGDKWKKYGIWFSAKFYSRGRVAVKWRIKTLLISYHLIYHGT